MKTTPTRSFLLALALAAVALPGAAAEPVNIAMLAGTTAKVVSGSGVEGTGFSGGTKIDDLFDGNLKKCTRLRDIGANGYIQIDFPEPYFVTSINVTKWYRHKYSLSISADGTNWTPVDYATSVNRYGTKSWGVYKTASYVRMSFPEGSTHCEDVAELEVCGVPVSGMACSHSTLSSWTVIAGSATCTTPPLENATCSECGEVFTRETDSAPLGHAYRTKVVERGKGLFCCKRCDFKVDCSDGAIELISQGGMSFDDKYVSFADVYVPGSLGWHESQSGVSRKCVIDGNLGNTWIGSQMNDYIDVTFGTTVLLTKVEVYMPTGDYTVKVSSRSGTSENLLSQKAPSGGDSYQSAVFEFDNQQVDAIRIRQTNPSYSQINVNEVRVYGTVPGEWTPDPFFILMQ